MNRLFKKRFGTLISALIFISTLSFSQFDNADFLRSAPADGVKFIEAYISPWTNAFGAGLNGGWYNTAKPHKLGGFDITTSFNMGFVPSSAGTFDISTLGLSSNLAPATGTVPTISGPKDGGLPMTYSVSGVDLASFTTPPGTNWKIIPVPTIQVGIGLPLGTELKVRYMPKLNIKDGDVSLCGVGLLHSIMQYIPGNKLLPLDVSLFAGYTKLTGNVPLSLQPEDGYTNNISSNISLNNQNLAVGVEALNISAIASLNLPVITFYGGIGYTKTKTLVELSGNFPTPRLNTSTGEAEYNDQGVIPGADFPNMEIKNFSGVRANIGLRIKLAVITIHADYTRAQYNVISTGLGISFR
ncbi:MAG TPA: DUF6588 family protein [Bacteroidales bacterium]|nr:DUF6588 family protein [Bacteroidales bacterium]